MSEDGIGKEPRPEKKEKRQKKPQYIGPDGIARPPKVEHQINECFSICFQGETGRVVLDYLKSVSTNRVLEPGLPEHTYAYQEGARWLMGVISTRIKDGEEKKP